MVRNGQSTEDMAIGQGWYERVRLPRDTAPGQELKGASNIGLESIIKECQTAKRVAKEGGGRGEGMGKETRESATIIGYNFDEVSSEEPHHNIQWQTKNANKKKRQSLLLASNVSQEG